MKSEKLFTESCIQSAPCSSFIPCPSSFLPVANAWGTLLPLTVARAVAASHRLPCTSARWVQRLPVRLVHRRDSRHTRDGMRVDQDNYFESFPEQFRRQHLSGPTECYGLSVFHQQNVFCELGCKI